MDFADIMKKSGSNYALNFFLAQSYGARYYAGLVGYPARVT
jgi:hypothetical protein